VTPLRTVRIIAGRELRDRLRNKAFTLGTLLIVGLVVAGIVLPTLLDDGDGRTHHLGVVGDAPPELDEAVREQLPPEDTLRVTTLPDRDAAATAVEAGDLDVVLLDAAALMVDGVPPLDLTRALDAALRQLEIAEELHDLGLTRQELAGVLAPREELPIVDPTGGQDDGPLGGLMAFAATILLFIAVQFNGSSLLTGAVEEKSSRVVEVLLGAVRPWQLLSGKLLALTLVSLLQIGMVAGAALGSNAVVGAIDLPPATGATVVVSLLMVVVGFLFYAALYTVAGAMASSVEDAQGTSGPLAFLLVGVYMLVIFVVIPAPGGRLAQVLTYLPPTAPFTVPARVALGAIPGWEIALATLVTLMGTVATVLVAARLYAAAILGGGRLTWREAWRTEPTR
jgi:ABC-2 type transport system permease protein